MTLLEAQTSIIEALVADVQECWAPRVVFTDQPVLPPTAQSGDRPLPEAYVNIPSATLDRPEQQRLTAPCLGEIPEYAVRLDVEIALRQEKPQGDPVRLQLHTQAGALRDRVLWNAGTRRLYAGVPAYWAGEVYQQDELEADPLSDDCLLRVQFYFVVTATLL